MAKRSKQKRLFTKKATKVSTDDQWNADALSYMKSVANEPHSTDLIATWSGIIDLTPQDLIDGIEDDEDENEEVS